MLQDKFGKLLASNEWSVLETNWEMEKIRTGGFYFLVN